MLNNKPSSTSLIRILGLFAAGAMLSACGSAPSQPEAQAVPEPTPVTVAEPEALPPAPPAEAILKPDHPERYVVVRGDTLWDIASRFLNDPWLWPQVWHINPEIRNPHLIYPGDVITLHYAGGKPHLTLEGEGGAPPPKDIKTVKLSPKVRYEKLDVAIETIPRSALGPFLQRPRVVAEDDLEDAPYIVSSYEGHLISSSDNKIYVKNIKKSGVAAYDVVRPGEVYRDPVTEEILGYEALSLANARVVRVGNPATLVVSDARAAILNGDRLIPSEEMKLSFSFFPFPPNSQVDGQIIAVLNGVSQIGQYNVVTINRGSREGLELGNVLAIYQRGKTVFDPYGESSTTEVTLPDERAGLLLVFRVYEKVSYALVMEATSPIHLFDKVANP